jgi:hypothetical protein
MDFLKISRLHVLGLIEDLNILIVEVSRERQTEFLHLH